MKDFHETGFTYKLDLIQQELKTINSIIDKVDNICQTAKYWTILILLGSISAILGSEDPEIHRLLLITPVIPLIFWIQDATWRRHQNRAIFRSNVIAEFLNGPQFEVSIEQGEINEFFIWDPMAIKYKDDTDYQQFVSFWRMFTFKTIARYYLSLMILGFLIAGLALIDFL